MHAPRRAPVAWTPASQGLIFFALPKAAERLGVGAARFYTQLLALQLCPAEFPFYLMVDDSVLMWQLADKPGEKQHASASWWKALSHYENPTFVNSARAGSYPQRPAQPPPPPPSNCLARVRASRGPR
jgi:hypothetical protein